MYLRNLNTFALLQVSRARISTVSSVVTIQKILYFYRMIINCVVPATITWLEILTNISLHKNTVVATGETCVKNCIKSF
jgi:hypothetical protein